VRGSGPAEFGGRPAETDRWQHRHRAVKARGYFPTEQAAMKCLYLVTQSLDPKGTGQTRWAMRWMPP
jgi:transposase-like protein